MPIATINPATAETLAGARVLTGGKPLDRPGNYYAPTVLADVRPGTPAYEEELFGPVAALFRVRDIGEAIRVANETSFGLGSSVWTTVWIHDSGRSHTSDTE